MKAPVATLPRRDVILETALRLLGDQGFESISMEEIRRAADVSNGSLFHHFPTKESLAVALYLGATRKYQAVLLKELERHRRPKRSIHAAVEAHLRWVARHPNETRCLHEMRRIRAVEKAKEELNAVNAEMFKRIRAWLDPNVKAGLVRDLPLDVFIAVVMGPTMEFTRAWLRDPDPRRAIRVAPLFADAAWRAIRSTEDTI